MLRDLPYERGQALEYARRWALGRNPLFYNFTGQGGDCTNFISQCLLAGCLVMNCRETFGWYYHSPRLRAPAWTGVQYLWNFLSGNAGAGPYGREAELAELVTGDLVQLGGEDGRYYHTLFICGRRGGELLIAAHSFDAFERPLMVRFHRNDLLKFRNFGKKSLSELDELLASLNLHFGMDVSMYKLDKD